MSVQMSTDLNEILSSFSSAIDQGYKSGTSGTSSRFGSVRLRGGSESRKHVPIQFLESVTSRASLIDNSSYSSTFWPEAVEPLDVEQEIEAQVDNKDENVQALADYPNDDLEIVFEDKQCRTIHCNVPDDQQSLPSGMKACINAYTRNYTYVKRRYETSTLECQKAILRTPKAEQRAVKVIYEGDGETASEAADNQSRKASDDDDVEQVAVSPGSDAFPHQSESDSLLDNIIKPTMTQDEIDDRNNQLRQENRQHDVLTLYSRWQSTSSTNTISPSMDECHGNEKRPVPPPPVEHFGHRIVVRCLSLDFEAEIEPIFISMALYDTKYKKKISENFYTELNKDYSRKLLKKTDASIYSLARSAIFSVSNLSHDIHLVIKLEKVLQQGDINDCIEPYLKDATEKSRDKAKQNANWFCDRLGNYRMPFAWTSIDIMKVMNEAADLRHYEKNGASQNGGGGGQSEETASSESISEDGEGDGGTFRERTLTRSSLLSESESNLLQTFKPFTVRLQFFYRQESERLKDEELLKLLSEMKRQGTALKKLKTIPVDMKMDIGRHTPNLSFCVTTDLLKVKPYPDARARPTREILEFPAIDVNIPYTTFQNILYVYPMSVNFSNRPNHSRNITVKVQLLANEDLSKALKSIYGKAYSSDFSTEAYTAVSYHNKSPDFNEEVKIQLPTRLTQNHHLFFSFFHISCQRKQDIHPIETPLGYTWIPLLSNGRLNTGEMSLPVSVDRPTPHYSIRKNNETLPGIKWVDGRKPVFNIMLRAASTVHMPDRHLNKFFDICQILEQPSTGGGGHHLAAKTLPDGTRINKISDTLKASFDELSLQTPEALLAKFLYAVLDKLISMMVRPPIYYGEILNIGINCFEVLTHISSRLHSSSLFKLDAFQRNVIMSTYTHYLLAVPNHTSPEEHVTSSSLHHTSSCAGNMTSSEMNGSGDSSNKSASLNYYATMTRTERSRPSVSPATFNMSSSNPDLTSVLPSPDANGRIDSCIPEYGDAASFMRRSGGRSSMMEQGNVKTETGTSVRHVTKKILHEEMVLYFVVSSPTVREKAMQNAWFMFEVITKSMALHLQYNKKLNAPFRQRTCFPQSFLDELQRLVKFVSAELLARYEKDYEGAERLNTAFAHLLYDLFSLINRTYTMNLVCLHYGLMNDRLSQSSSAGKSSRDLLQLRSQFTRILCNHEHYVTLNLPFISPPSPPSPTLSIMSSISTLTSATALHKSNSRYELTDRFQKQHYLTGILLYDIRRSIELVEQGHASALKMQAYSIETLKNLLTSHDYDERINCSKQIKRTVASLYQPLFTITLQALPIMYMYNEEDKVGAASGGGKDTGASEDGMINPNIASAIANPFNQMTKGTRNTSGKLQMTPNSTRDLLVCFFWLLKNTEESMLKTWWSSLPYSHIMLLLEVLYVSLSCFELKSRYDVAASAAGRNTAARASVNFGGSRINKNNKSRLEGVIRGENSARQEMLNRRRAEKSGTLRDGLRWNKNQTEWKQNKENSDQARHVIDDSPHSRVFSSETSMMTLDAIQMVVDSTFETSEASRNVATFQILSSAFRVLLHLFSKRQSVAVQQHAFAIQRSLVSKFPEHLLDEDTEQCSDLASQLLQKCSSSSTSIRQNAAASLYMLMRHNYSVGNTFSRVRMQITMSMSSLVGVDSHDFHEDYLRRSLKTILAYSDKDVELQNTAFPEQVRELILNLHTILSDTVKMKKHKDDPEMLCDLMYRIAKGYRTSPNLRLTWLQNMAKKHSEKNNFVEAGMCYLHCAGLVSEYLALIEYKSYLPTGCAGFENITGNILEESVVSDDIITSTFGEMSSDDKFFSIPGLTQLLEKSIEAFTDGGLFEVVLTVSEHTKRIYQYEKMFGKMKQMYDNLTKSCSKINAQSAYGGWERMFGTYFRVAFYGSKFGDLNGMEFIQKEPAITKLPEISLRLETFYERCFGQENVTVLKDSSEVDVEKLDPKRAYIQITYVEPYFYEYEEHVKTTYFERNFNMDKFMYATPFTKNGKAHGEMKDQYKRKTFLQVANSFPYVKTRINVVRKWEKVLSPLESACEDIKKKTTDLLKAVQMNPPDVRMLQINLQGAVMTAVNQGPMHVANTFLDGDLSEDSTQWIPLNDMRLSFKKFLHVCSMALKANKKMIKSDQQEYQREMERNYTKMSEQLRPLVADRKVVHKIQQLHQRTRLNMDKHDMDKHDDIQHDMEVDIEV